MKLIGVGVGPGDIELFTLKAINAIEEAAYIFIPESRGKSIAYDIARPLLEDKYNIIFLDIPMGCGRDLYKTYAERIFRTSEGKTSVFLTLGDPSIYSTFIYIADEIKNLGGDVSTIPGIPSFIAAAALIGEPLLRKGDKMIVCDSIDEIDLKGLDAVVVLKTLDKEKILNLLEEEGFKYFYIKRCTQKDEMVLTDRDDILKDNDYLSMIIAKGADFMVYFIGAGPGDVDLITVKGRRLLKEADVVIYAGSLVSTEHLNFCKEGVEVYDSSSMNLDEITQIIGNAYRQGKRVVRLHTGDPTLYGAILEQMRELDKLNIPYEVVPGVSSFTASCARVKREFTVPEVTQTVILTRISGRTPVPEEEDLEVLAAHKSSMAIFLSVHEIDRVVEKLKRGYQDENVPCAVVYKATWQDEEVILGTLKDIADKVKDKNIRRTAQILVGYFLNDNGTYSRLYDKNFSHEFRDAL